MKKSNTNKQPPSDTNRANTNKANDNKANSEKANKEETKAVNDFLNLIAAPGLIRSNPTTEKETKKAIATEIETKIVEQKPSSKKTISKKKGNKNRIKTKADEPVNRTEKALMVVRVDPQLFHLVKFASQIHTKASHDIMNPILQYWLEHEHPEMLSLLRKKK